MEWLKGKKSYLIAGAIILLVILEKVLGIDVPGVELGDNWGEWILGAGGLSALRAGVGRK